MAYGLVPQTRPRWTSPPGAAATPVPPRRRAFVFEHVVYLIKESHLYQVNSRHESGARKPSLCTSPELGI